MSGGWALSLALIGLGFMLLGVWSHVERLDRERTRPEDTHKLLDEIRRHESDG